MEHTETPRIQKYGESKTTRIMMATLCHVTSSSGLRKFQAAYFLLNRGNHTKINIQNDGTAGPVLQHTISPTACVASVDGLRVTVVFLSVLCDALSTVQASPPY
jgi:hypothetical protein